MESERLDTVVIGGGQAGLAVGYYLARRGKRFVILDASNRIGDGWRSRYDSLRLFTPAHLNCLPGLPFPAPAWSFPGKDDMADYLEAYAARFDLPVRSGVPVRRLGREGDHFVAVSHGQRFEAANVVVATGGLDGRRVPAFAAELDKEIVQLHSSAYRRPSQLPAGDVLVVGAGNSGADIALELSGSRTTWLSGRHPGSEPVRPGSLGDRVLTPAVWFAASRLLTVQTGAGRRLRSKLSSGGHPLARVKPKDLAAAGVRRLPRTVGARSGAPAVEDHRAVDVASVIWATGYRSNFGWIDLPSFGPDGQPLHHRGVVHSEPGLYFVGLPFMFTLTSSLVGGVGRDAEHIAEHIAGHIAGHLGASEAHRRISHAAAASTPPTPLPGPRRFRRALAAQGRRS